MKGLFAPLFPVFFLLSSSILALFKTFRNSDVFALILKRTILVKYSLDKLRTILLQALTRFCRRVLQSESVSLTAHCSLSRRPALEPEQGSVHSKWRMAWHCTGLIVPVMQSVQPRARALTTLASHPNQPLTRQTRASYSPQHHQWSLDHGTIMHQQNITAAGWFLCFEIRFVMQFIYYLRN